MFFFDFPFFKSSYFAFNLDPFDEFARAIAADNPGKYTVPGTNPESWKCKRCGEFAVKRVVSSDGLDEIWFCDEHYKELQDSKKDKKKSRQEEFEEYEAILTPPQYVNQWLPIKFIKKGIKIIIKNFRFIMF